MPTPPSDIMLNKAAIIERCVRRVKEEYAAAPDLTNPTRVDALTLNIERACQAAIDLAMHLISSKHLGIPQSSAGAFDLLGEAGLISAELTRSLRAMTGSAMWRFMNIRNSIWRSFITSRGKDIGTSFDCAPRWD